MYNTDTNKTKDFFENSYKNININEERKKELLNIADKIAINYVFNDSHININFICTHNSRRSQLGQVWCFFAAKYFNLNINALSGGTEVTAFHRNTVQTLKEVGFTFTVEDFSHSNPTYKITCSDVDDSLLAFSKTYDNSVNTTPYIVLTTCNHADEKCPFIPEATHRFHLPYKDPKHSDGSRDQEITYLKTNSEIASEMYFLFNEVKTLV